MRLYNGNTAGWTSVDLVKFDNFRLEVSGVSGSQGSAIAKINWLMADHLGTPRMIFDQTGLLANVERHDYLPFGEELSAGVGGRSAERGYEEHTVRQKFTGKERDGETELDYFLARYYSSSQGRFLSADSVAGAITNPQTQNLYAYVHNNPLQYIDPSGHLAVGLGAGGHNDNFKKDRPNEAYLGNLFELPLGLCGTGCSQGGQQPQRPPGQKPPTELGPNGELPVDGDAVLVIDATPASKAPFIPNENPGENFLERYLYSPTTTILEVVDWTSKNVRKFGYAVAPDYVYVNAGVPLVMSGSLQYSKDKRLYYSFVGPTGGVKNMKFGGQAGVAYFATTEMTEAQRDGSIQGPGINAAVPHTPFGAYFPLQGTPAVTLGFPFSAGVNGSLTRPFP